MADEEGGDTITIRVKDQGALVAARASAVGLVGHVCMLGLVAR